MKQVFIAAVLLAALGAPAMAADTAVSRPMPQSKSAVETTTVLSRPAQDSKPALWVPKYLTIQQQNDAAQREFEETFHVIHMP